MLFGRLLKMRFQETLTHACAVGCLFIAIAGTMEGMLSVVNGTIESSGAMTIIISLTLGGLIGEWIDLDSLMIRFGEWLKEKTGNSGDNSFVNGFVTASLTVSIGAMAIIGSIQDGILGDYSILAAKSVLDLIIIMVMTSSMGKGCAFSAIPVFIFEGGMTLLARVISPLMTDAALFNISMVGNILIFCVGINLLWGPKIRVANFLPSLIIAMCMTFLPL